MTTNRSIRILVAIAAGLAVWAVGGYLLWIGLLNFLANQANEITDLNALNRKAMDYGMYAFIASFVAGYLVYRKLRSGKGESD